MTTKHRKLRFLVVIDTYCRKRDTERVLRDLIKYYYQHGKVSSISDDSRIVPGPPKEVRQLAEQLRQTKAIKQQQLENYFVSAKPPKEKGTPKRPKEKITFERNVSPFPRG